MADKILVVDDEPSNVSLLSDILSVEGYEVETASDGEQALRAVERQEPDLVLLDVVMPGLSGFDVCRRLRADERHASLPIVLVTALDPDSERMNGLAAGADDFLGKPVNVSELLGRVRSLVRVKHLFDRNEAQAARLRQLNEDLEQMVAAKVREVERLSRLKRFVSPQLARRILDGETDDPLVSHRADVAVVFFDLRGFTAFSERSAPEDVMAVLREFHGLVGTQTVQHGGTIERYNGDGAMVLFNDPEPVPDPCAHSARFAHAVREAGRPLVAQWRSKGFDVDFGAGLAYGYATLGAIGFADRIEYGAIGSAVNLAARLCAEARGGEILVSARAASALTGGFVTQSVAPFSLKGFRDPMPACLLVGAGD